MLHGEMVMTGSGPAMMPPMTGKPQSEQIDTRFGKVTISRKNPITFATGLLGFPDRTEYCLTTFPSQKMARFKMLQSLEDESLAFITLPVDNTNPLFDPTDLMQAANDLGIPLPELTTLLIVSVHRDSVGVKLSVNARAPIFINASKRTATQHVFSTNKYNIRHMLTM